MDNRLGHDSSEHDIAMVLDLKLKAEVLLGHQRMALGDLIGLQAGEIVELNRRAEQPLELVVNGAVVAHGEIVIMDERYGLRLTNIVSPSERSCPSPYHRD
jgi:flagellar motor switch protein FliN/FliY